MRLHLLPLAIALTSFGCAGTDSSEGRPANTPSAFATGGDHAKAVVRAGDGSVRVPFLGGSFVTYNTDMPVEVEEAVQGKRTTRPVVVWAGNEAGMDRNDRIDNSFEPGARHR